jgi:hypothetical protein
LINLQAQKKTFREVTTGVNVDVESELITVKKNSSENNNPSEEKNFTFFIKR